MKRHIIGRLALAAIGLSLIGGVAIAQTYGNGPLISTPGAPVYMQPVLTPVATSVAAATLVLKAASGNLFSVTGQGGAAVAYMIVQNSTTAAASGTVVPVLCAAIPANSTTTINLPVPAAFNVGIAVSLSATSCFSMASAGSGFISGLVQ